MRSLVFILLFLPIACGRGSGEFSFFSADMSDLSLLDKKFYRPSEFRKMRQPIHFETDEVIWFSYEPVSVSPSILYAVSLQKKSLGYIEKELRNLRLSPETRHLIDKYENLEPGEYLLKVAAEGKNLTQISFSVLEDSNEDAVDYNAPADDDAETDDIIAFSR